jgi:hypothetical protein
MRLRRMRYMMHESQWSDLWTNTQKRGKQRCHGIKVYVTLVPSDP